MTLERTLQQRDPLAALVGRRTSYLAAIGIPFYAAIMMSLNAEEIVAPGLALVSLALVIATGVVFIRASSPMRAPFDRPRYLVVLAGALLAHLFGTASMWGENAYVRDDWGPSVIGLFLLALAPFRPGRDILLAGLASALVVGATVAAQFQTLASPVPVYVLVVVAETPIVGLAVGSAVFAAALVRALDRWQSLESMSADDLAGERSDDIARSVRKDRVTILNREVVPFFSRVIEADDVGAEDRERARQLADGIRAAMVADVERGWLDGVLDELARAGNGRGSIRDQARQAELLNVDQRTVLRAVLVVLQGQPGFEPESLRLAFEARGDSSRGVVAARVDAPEPSVRALLEPYLAVMQVLFDDLQVEFAEPALILRFAYGHR